MAFHLGQSALEARDTICSTWGETAISYSTCKKWYAKFRKGNFDLQDGDHREQPTSSMDKELENLLEEDPDRTVKELANRMGVTQGALIVRLKKLGRVQKKGRWVRPEDKKKLQQGAKTTRDSTQRKKS